jgi:hypothetical protein
MKREYGWSDEDMLMALQLRDEGKTMEQAGRAIGRPKNAIAGLYFRINTETAASDPDGNQNGTMPAMWWKAGLQARKEVANV